MNKKLVIAGGAAVLLVGIIFIIFSSNDELAEVIHEVESEVAQERMDALTGSSTDEALGQVAEENDVPSAQGTQRSVESAPITNSVVLGEVDAGNVITVPRATLLQDGYIVLYRINSNGETSLAGKSGLLEAGTHTNTAIQLAATAVKRQALVAVLHGDDGDGKFEYPGADQYLLNGVLLANDIDVVGVERSDRESKILETQVEAFLETNFMN